MRLATDGCARRYALASSPQALELGVARAAFIRVRDPRAVDLADRLAAGLAGGMPRGLLLGDALAWQGRYAEAARCFANEGRLDKVGVRSETAPARWHRGPGKHSHSSFWEQAAALPAASCVPQATSLTHGSGCGPLRAQRGGPSLALPCRCWTCSLRCASLTRPISGRTSTRAWVAAQVVRRVEGTCA